MGKNIKKCRICNLEKEATTEFFYGKHNKLDSRCKECFRSIYKRKYHENIEYERLRSRTVHKNRTKEQLENKRIQSRKWHKTDNGIYKSYVGNARKRNICFEIEKEDFKKLLHGNCYYCNTLSNGVDRRDNNVGYTKSNCVSCCSKCNIMKMDLSEKDFINRCIEISNLFLSRRKRN